MKHYLRCLLAGALVTCASVAAAGTLATDGSSYLGTWHGSAAFQGYFLGGVMPSGLTGTIDYAVYAPGTFPAGFAGYTPTPGEFVYAYQAFETGPAPLSAVSINLLNPADQIGTFSGGGVSGDAPLADFLAPFDSANWLFTGVLVPQGGSTSGLVFSSPGAPIWSTASTIDDGTVGLVLAVPTPGASNGMPNTPEPGTFALALLAAAAFALHRRRHSRRQTN